MLVPNMPHMLLLFLHLPPAAVAAGAANAHANAIASGKLQMLTVQIKPLLRDMKLPVCVHILAEPFSMAWG